MKASALKGSNVALFLAACLLAASGLLLEFRLDEDESGTILSLARDDWAELHLIVAFVFLGLTVLHVALNCKWVTSLARAKWRWPTIAAGVAGALIQAGILLAPAATGGRHHEGAHEAHSDD
jgi:hypothetical protein